jgi:hypothetical protein
LRFNFRQYGGRNFLRPVVQLGRQALELDVCPAVQVADAHQLAGDGAAGDNQGCWGIRVQDAFLISSLAVSTAVAASRQYASAPMAAPNSSFSGAPPTSTM